MDISRTLARAAPVDRTPVSEDTDLAIVRRVQGGEIQAYDQLVRKHRERLYAIIYNLTGNREDAADVTQEAFVKAFRSLDRFKLGSSFYTWLYRIGVNAALSHLKKNRRRQFFSFEQMGEEAREAEVVEALARKTGSDRDTLLGELQEKLNESLQKLSHKHRTVVILHEIEGMGHAEIAEVVGASEGTVRSRLHYAKQQLQGYLQEYLKSGNG